MHMLLGGGHQGPQGSKLTGTSRRVGGGGRDARDPRGGGRGGGRLEIHGMLLLDGLQ